jgi:hypothetical protein
MQRGGADRVQLERRAALRRSVKAIAVGQSNRIELRARHIVGQSESDAAANKSVPVEGKPALLDA